MSKSESSLPSRLTAQPVAIDLPDACLRYLPHWLDRATADVWLHRLIAETPWEQPQVRVYGRTLAVPRLVAWYGDAEARYRYSGLLHEPLPWTPLLEEIRRRLQAEVDGRFNGALLNLYRDGQDAMGWHSDDEPELGCEPLLASLSLGAVRRFDLRRKGSSRIEHSLALGHGSLLVMGGATQHHWQHQIARTRQVLTPRLNLTFRLIHPSPKP
ncbi:alpha-ketoglutarate-dependent dioxygenase AlkB [Stutzerimonas stutzeri]|uniref:Alpha-ketoglutarate-dependent dioxygenase AlkB n=1 Tax=Stutzerimonas stutzeri TaxID=316 RepID=A0A2N8SRH1_STUST|nr:alpha-ketoglutarate-dependent dioxygenase AlkB [Stutzerimonas stutzeri]MCQ4327496.1 alpha-ketoglutarate-dependent dioxygenase AlkB [Stutzerimonas stutzeri]PNG05094.1 alpha-ketoglutarate-dependent dioxygenase AlkB [Stutzerimonas stutzeri]